MTWIRALFVLLAAAGIGEASVTVAWKMPVESVAPAFADAPPLGEPPGDSAFFQPGDKLWDLSKRVNWQRPDEVHPDDQGDPFAVTEPGFIDVDWKGDWIVWNPRSGMIVVRGSWHDVLVAEQVLGCGDQPNLIRTRIELKGTGNPRILSLVSRGGRIR